jgi:acyl carrier protein
MTGEIYSELTFKKIQQVLARLFEVPAEEISNDTNFFTDLNFSAMQFAELTVQLEMDFEKKLFDKDALRFKTVGEMVNHIAKSMGATPKDNKNDTI